MKLKTWNKLEIGDVVRVRTEEEMRKLKGVFVNEKGNFVFPDRKSDSLECFVLPNMQKFCGGEYEVKEINASFCLLSASNFYRFTRKMLVEE